MWYFFLKALCNIKESPNNWSLALENGKAPGRLWAVHSGGEVPFKKLEVKGVCCFPRAKFPRLYPKDSAEVRKALIKGMGYFSRQNMIW